MTLKDTIGRFAHVAFFLDDSERCNVSISWSIAHDLWVAVKAGQAEIDALTERNAFLLTSAETAQAKLAEARAEVDAVRFAAHMPDDYAYGLSSWINQHLYAAYIGVRQSPEFMAMIEKGQVTFPNSPAEKMRLALENGIRAEHDRADKAEAEAAKLRKQVADLRDPDQKFLELGLRLD